MPRITIGIGTHKRPKMLAKTLESLCSLQIPENCEAQLLMIDNAPEAPATGVFNEYSNRLPFSCFYFQESKKGLVYMRERMLQEAGRLNTDYLACIDDDEIAEPDWLLHHYNTLIKYKADIVSGRTLRILPGNTPKWIIDGGFFNKPSRPTGVKRTTSSNCNVFYNYKKVYIDLGIRYDERLNFIGEDILFFRQAHEKGARIVWCNESILHEVIPESRVTQRSLLERAFATGTSTAYRYRRISPAYLAYPRMFFFMIGECLVAASYLLKSDEKMAPINETRRKHHMQLAKGVYNGLFKMKGAEIYKQQHGS